MVTRKIFKNATTSQSAIRDALAFLFAQELLTPSAHIFVVAPWISNIVLFDNRQGGFMSLNPEWSRTDIYLIEVLTALAARGSHLHIHVNGDTHNRYFETRLKEALGDTGVLTKCIWKAHQYLHTKGILTEQVLISGSMNLTRNGVKILDESVDINYDPNALSAARVHYDLYEQS